MLPSNVMHDVITTGISERNVLPGFSAKREFSVLRKKENFSRCCAQERELFSLLPARKRIFLYVARKNENSPLIYWGDPKIVSCNSDRLIFDFDIILGIPYLPCARKRIFLYVACKKENFSLCCAQERELFSLLRKKENFSLSCATCESIPRLKRI